ncbi:kinase-like domain-containing protein [Radiomyces spectabilis]|uniref:kinase-like domain-containing protein n=1 Tax=Radiomyces spectabilis TaxID=64574 RepID=UPI00221E81A7|nr:kinase-like domain-containing protein [Radiomyces spectabilis]KAI8371746.1 kinase-like domain-containing protein [Radiomyces spectabilis]
MNHCSSRRNDNTTIKPNNALRIDTDPLGISYQPDNDHDEQYYSELFRQLHHHHHHHEDPQNPTYTDNVSSHLTVHHRPSTEATAPLPSLSLTSSPSSSRSSSVTTSPILQSENATAPPVCIPRRDVTHRSKCQLTRRSTLTSPAPNSSGVSSKSWNHIKSPAATFLASFASPVQTSPTQEEDGDEIDDYVLGKVIGHGGFSVVREGYCISDGHKVAVKVIAKSQLDDTEQMRLDRELAIWKSLDHPSIVVVEKVLETDYAVYVICDYCPHGSLLNRLKEGPLSEQESRRIFIELCQALQYLHHHCKVCHKDIKLDNVLLDRSGHVKLCDFGLAVYQTPTTAMSSPSGMPMTPSPEPDPAGGSLAYMAPEQLKANTVLACPKTDIWSLGVVLYALVTGRLPFADDYELRLQQKVMAGQFDLPDHLSTELKSLIQRCLQTDPQDRLSVEEVLNMPWCQQH